jgi:hypothetical protein
MTNPKWDDTEEIAPTWDETTEVDEGEKFSQLEAGLRGASQGITFGHSDEIAAGIGSAYEGLTGGDSTYEEILADQRRQDRESADQWPKTALAGEVGAGLAMGFIPGVGQASAVVKAGKLANYLNKIKKASVLSKAAAGGALYGAGTSDEDMIESPGAFAKDVGIGAATGAGSQAVLGGLAKGIKALPRAAREGSQNRAVKAAIGESIKHRRKLSGTTHNAPGDIRVGESKLRAAGQQLLDERLPSGDKMMKGGMSVGDIAPRISDTKNKYGKQLGQIQDLVDDITPDGSVNVEGLKKRLQNVVEEIPDISGGTGQREKVLAVAEKLDELHPTGKMSFKDAKHLKSAFNYKATDTGAEITNQDVLNKINQAFSGQLEEATDAAIKKIPKGSFDIDPKAIGPVTKGQGTKDLLDKYKNIKGKYGAMKTLENASADRATRNQSNRMISPSSYGVGATAGVRTGDTLFSATMAMAHQVAMERGASAASRTLEKLANTMEKNPKFMKIYGNKFLRAMERGPAAMIATHKILQKNPEYQRYMEEKK